MMPVSETVSLVVDPDFGSRLAELAETGPVWAVHSPENRRAAEALWALVPALPPDHVMVFNATRSREEDCLSMFETIDEHHPGWSRLSVIGIGPSPRLLAALASLWPGSVEEQRDGFVYVRRESLQ